MRRKKQTTSGTKPARKTRAATRAKTATRKAPAKTAPARKGAARKAAAGRSAPAKSAAKKAGVRAKAAAAKAAVKPSRKSAKTTATGAAGKASPRRPAKAKSRKNRPAPEMPPIEIEVRDLPPVPQAATEAPLLVSEPAAIAPSGSAPRSAEARGQPAGSGRKGGAESASSSEAPARTNKLVPTNAVHTTNRRLKRGIRQNRVFAAVAAALLVALLILSDREQPPDVSPLEQKASNALADAGADTAALSGGPALSEATPRSEGSELRGSDGAATRTPRTAWRPRIADPVQADPDRSPQVAGVPTRPAAVADAPGHSAPRVSAPEAPDPAPRVSLAVTSAAPTPLVRFDGLSAPQIAEMERMLARLDLHPSAPDGMVDDQTESAIRLYQQIAGLPVDGEASQTLLDDMREVVKILEKSE